MTNNFIPGAWRVDKDTHIPIPQMEDEHLKRAVLYCQKRGIELVKKHKQVQESLAALESKRLELVEEMEKRGIDPISLSVDRVD